MVNVSLSLTHFTLYKNRTSQPICVFFAIVSANIFADEFCQIVKCIMILLFPGLLPEDDLVVDSLSE